MKFPKITQHQKKSMVTVNVLLPVIGSYNVGDKLPAERQLATELGISRNTLREAIAALQLMGIIEVRHREGNFIVKLPDETDAMQPLDSIFQPAMAPFSMSELREAFEPGIAWLAAQNRKSTDLAQIEQHLQDIKSSLKLSDPTKYSEADMLFHLTIARATYNEMIIETITPIILTIRSPLWQAMKKGLDDETLSANRAREHDFIFQHIANSDSQEAAKAMREHLSLSKSRLLQDRE